MVADCALSTSSSRHSVAAYSGWSQERLVWSSREVPYVATYNEVCTSRACCTLLCCEPACTACVVSHGVLLYA